MSFDDLAFPGFGARPQVRKLCPSCEDSRMIGADEWNCPTCGERMVLAPTHSNYEGGDGPTNPMLTQLLHQSMAAAAAAASSSDGGGASDGSGSDLASQLQGMFIPSLNGTYMDMIRAQQGVSIETLMTQLLQNESLNAPPTSKRFIEGLTERALTKEDFIQLYLRFPGTLDRDIFPTVANFGSGQRFLHQHAEAELERVQKLEEAKKIAAAVISTTTSSTTPSTAASTTDSTATTTTPTPNASTLATTEEEPAPSPPQEHISCTLLISNPLSGKNPLNSKLFRGQFLLMERGVISFVAKARLVQDGMGRGLIVMQTEPDEKAWPFTMSDNEKKGGDIIIPVLMISKSDGEALQAAIKKRKDGVAAAASSTTSTSSATTAADKKDDGVTQLKVMTRERPLACSVCRDDYTLDSRVIELPCHHYYCLDCIKPWLLKRSNCPLCRFALPTDAPKLKEDLQGPDSNHAQLQRDMFT